VNPDVGLRPISFTNRISQLTSRFVGRQWILDQLNYWLVNSSERVFLIVGEPGVGKSALAAHIVNTGSPLSAFHFCIALEGGTLRPVSVLLSLAAQLVQNVSDYAETLASVVAPLRLSIRVEITAENIRDSVIRGVVIEELHAQNARDALDITLRQTIAALPQRADPILILIDGLDESIAFSPTENLVALLSATNDLPESLRFIFTTRPDERGVLSYLRPLNPLICELAADNPNNLGDLDAYVSERLSDSTLARALETRNVSAREIRKRLVASSSGNFLYATLILDDLEHWEDTSQSLDLSALPVGLADIYHRFLLRIRPDLQEFSHRVLEILCVVESAISKASLQYVCRDLLEHTSFQTVFSQIRPFLDISVRSEGEFVSLYHASFRDYLLDERANRLLPCSREAGLRAIVAAYWRYHPLEWEACDSYGLLHLPAHLAALGEIVQPPAEARIFAAKLHELLIAQRDSRNIWYSAKIQKAPVSSYVEDVKLARRFASIDGPQRAVALRVRYALILSSINSIAARVPHELVVRLVSSGVWSPVHAAGYAVRILDPKQRAGLLSKLVRAAPELRQATEECISNISDPRARVEALTELATAAPELVPNVLSALTALGTDLASLSYRVDALTKLAVMCTELLPDAVAAARNYPFAGFKVNYLLRLVPQAPELMVDVLASSGQAMFRYERDLILRQARMCVASIGARVFAAAAEVGVQDELLLLLVITGMADLIPAPMISDALRLVLSLEDDRIKASGLRELIPHMTDAQIVETYPKVMGIGDLMVRARVLCRMRPRVRPDFIDYSALLQEIPEQHRGALIVDLACGDQSYLDEALRFARSRLNEYECAALFTDLAAVYPEHWRDAISAISRIHEIADRSNAVIDLLFRLPSRMFGEVLAATRHFLFGNGWSAVVRMLPEELLLTGLGFIAEIPNLFQKINALETLVTRLPDAALGETLGVVQRIGDTISRTVMLVKCGKDGPVVQDVLNRIHLIDNEKERVEVILAVVRFLGPVWAEWLMGEIRNVRDHGMQAAVLEAAVPTLPESLLPATVELARVIPDSYSRSRVLFALASRVPELRGEAIDALLKSEFGGVVNPEDVAALLVGVARYFPEGHVAAMKAIEAIPNDMVRSAALEDLIPYLVEDEAFRTALSVLDKIAEQFRAHCLRSFGLVVPPSIMEEFVARVRSMESPWARGVAYHGVIGRLPSSLLPSAEDVLQVLLNEADQTEFLRRQPPQIPLQMLSAVATLALQLEDERQKSFVLAQLISQLPEEWIDRLSTSLAAFSVSTRARLVATIARRRPSAIPEALLLLRQSESGIRAELLSELASCNGELVGQTLHAIGALEDEHEKGRRLKALVPFIGIGDWQETVALVKRISDDSVRSECLIALAEDCERRPDKKERILDVLEASEDSERPTIIQLMAVGSGSLQACAGHDFPSCLEEVDAVANWWP
jgi:AAA ATPase domain